MMKTTRLLKSMLLLCALIVGSGSVWGEETYSLTPNQSSTGIDEKSYVTTLPEYTYNGVSWKMDQWNPKTLKVRTNQGSATAEFRFYNTSAFVGRITKVVITFSALTVSDATKLMFLGGTSEVNATTGGTAGTWDSGTKTLTWTPGVGENYNYFAFYQNGAAASGENYLAATDAIVVTYDSDVLPTSNLSINFESNDISSYSTSWVFNNIGIHSHNNPISAHAGTYYGSNVNGDGNGVSSAYIQTRSKIINPGSFSCWISKESDNTSASSWKVQVSNNGSDWTDVETADATSMSKGTWVEVTADLTTYSDVYVRLSYSSSNAKRAVDDIKLTMVKRFTLASACTDGEKYYGTFSCNNAFVVPEGITVSALKIVDGKLSYMDYAKDDVVPASTGVLVSSTTYGTKIVYLSDGAGAEKVGNMLKPSGDAGIDAASMNIDDTKFYRLTMHNGSTIGFWWGAAGGAAFDLGANKAYLAVPETAAREGFSFDNEATGIAEMKAMRNVANETFYNLAGQRVNANHKGLVIVNGKKYLNK